MYEAVPESMANETVDDLDASTEALRHAAEDTPTGTGPGDVEKTPGICPRKSDQPDGVSPCALADARGMAAQPSVRTDHGPDLCTVGLTDGLYSEFAGVVGVHMTK
jgi:hypothetical protein